MADKGTPKPETIESLAALSRGNNPPPEVMVQGESIEQFQELMKHLQQVFWIKNVATKGVLYVSPAYETVWGRTCQSLYDDFRSLEDSIHPEDRGRVAGPMDGDDDVAGREEEFRILRPDGEVRWIRSKSYPVRNERGQIQRHAGIDEDITDWKASEGDRSRLAAIVEYSEDVVISTSVDGIIINWNHGAERQYGYSASEILGHSVSVLFPPDHFKEYAEVMKKIRQGTPIPSYDTVRLRKDGSLVNMSVSISPIENRTGQVVGASKIGHDLSKIKALEAQFIEAQKMEVVGELAGGVAHDFNNILAIIMGYNDLMEQDFDAESPFRKYTEEIRLASQRAAGLTQQLLLFSRKQTVQAVVLNLNEVVESMDQMLRRVANEHIEMSVICAEGIGQIKSDSGYVGQLLMNLVGNSCDAMPKGGKLTIETSTVSLTENDRQLHPRILPGQYVVLSVSDTGTGMTDEIKAKIFEAFFTTKGLGKGTGLGLATCQMIVRQSGGSIEVCSEIGKGTTFKIYFPRIDAPANRVTDARQSGRLLPRGTETLMLVEDEPSLRQLAQNTLQIQGYEVLLASNGEEGLRLARERKGDPISLVITDIIMPIMGGKVMAEWLKTIYPEIKVLFTSGYTDEAIAETGFLDEVVEFLPKPYTRSTLSRKVREMLDGPQ